MSGAPRVKWLKMYDKLPLIPAFAFAVVWIFFVGNDSGVSALVGAGIMVVIGVLFIPIARWLKHRAERKIALGRSSGDENALGAKRCEEQ